jgi:hypothetical protein
LCLHIGRVTRIRGSDDFRTDGIFTAMDRHAIACGIVNDFVATFFEDFGNGCHMLAAEP